MAHAKLLFMYIQVIHFNLQAKNKEKKISRKLILTFPPFLSPHPFSTHINSSPVIPRGVLQQLRIFPAKPLFHHNAGGSSFSGLPRTMPVRVRGTCHRKRPEAARPEAHYPMLPAYCPALPPITITERQEDIFYFFFFFTNLRSSSYFKHAPLPLFSLRPSRKTKSPVKCFCCVLDPLSRACREGCFNAPLILGSAMKSSKAHKKRFLTRHIYSKIFTKRIGTSLRNIVSTTMIIHRMCW
ncbi:hypothetical protein CDAR_63461 [Caerostris darwini]|uniref:Uncharacterized protein n=1 Tax=Caerostris darwini TaxID=1538125 RepID=A0AAV4QIW2_9ARAC|nr:hypothetical protein CDAR_63461 [Caerostris darwini]